MTHQEALQFAAAEKYLLDELAAPERDAFEAHYFDCPDCAADLRATAAFLEAAQGEFRRQAATQAELPAQRQAPARPQTGAPPEAPGRARVAPAVRPSRFAFLWRPAFAGPAWALLLLVIVYQNVVLHPRPAGGMARIDRPQVLAAVSLIGAGGRGGGVPAVTVANGQPLLLTVDIAAAEQYSGYSCELIAPGGAVLWQLPVSPKQAQDTVSIRVPGEHWARGDYTLLVQGYADAARQKPTEVARYRFAVNAGD